MTNQVQEVLNNLRNYSPEVLAEFQTKQEQLEYAVEFLRQGGFDQ